MAEAERLWVQNLGSLNACLSAPGEVANKKTPSPIPLWSMGPIVPIELVGDIKTDTLTNDQTIGPMASAIYPIQSTRPISPSPVAVYSG